MSKFHTHSILLQGVRCAFFTSRQFFCVKRVTEKNIFYLSQIKFLAAINRFFLRIFLFWEPENLPNGRRRPIWRLRVEPSRSGTNGKDGARSIRKLNEKWSLRTITNISILMFLKIKSNLRDAYELFGPEMFEPGSQNLGFVDPKTNLTLKPELCFFVLMIFSRYYFFKFMRFLWI